MRHGIEDEVRKEFEKKFTARQKALSGELAQRTKELERKEKELEGARETIDKEVEERVKAQQEKLKKKARAEIEDEFSGELKAQGERLEKALAKLKEAQGREADLLTQKAELEDQKRELGLQVQRIVDQKRKEFEEIVRAQETEKWEGQLRVKDEELDRMKKALDQAQRVGTSGELMGEMAEKTLEDRLKRAFPDDKFEPVGRVKRGADVLQTVQGGGSILWESKDGYSSWSNDWIPKLKRDRDAEKASVGILVTTIGPGGKAVRTPTFDDGVVLAPPGIATGVASLLRPQVTEVARQRRLYDKQESLQAAVYTWVTSQDFQRGVAAIVENLYRLENRVSRAKANNAKWFRHMAEDVDLTIASVGEFYGSARSHARLPDLKALALNPGESSDSDDKDEEDESGTSGSTERSGSR